MLLDRSRSLLLAIDIQDVLLPALHQPQQLLQHAGWMIELALACDIPVIFSEQYPRGLGSTATQLRRLAPQAPAVAKQAFSCVAAQCLPQTMLAPAEQIVLVGIEAHVCVLQTAIELQQAGKQVFVIADAVSSRSAGDTDLALARMRSLGIQIISREMALFEWARTAGTPLFKTLSQRFLQKPS